VTEWKDTCDIESSLASVLFEFFHVDKKHNIDDASRFCLHCFFTICTSHVAMTRHFSGCIRSIVFNTFSPGGKHSSRQTQCSLMAERQLCAVSNSCL
jgi:hypothetical protein